MCIFCGVGMGFPHTMSNPPRSLLPSSREVLPVQPMIMSLRPRGWRGEVGLPFISKAALSCEGVGVGGRG